MSSTGMLFKDVKNFLFNEVNRVFVAVIFVGIINLVSIVRTEMLFIKLNEQNNEYYNQLINSDNKIEKKIDYRYFNITKSLEEIHSVKIITKDGKLEK